MESRSKEATWLKTGGYARSVRLFGLEIGLFLAKIWLIENDIYIYKFWSDLYNQMLYIQVYIMVDISASRRATYTILCSPESGDRGLRKKNKCEMPAPLHLLRK